MDKTLYHSSKFDVFLKRKSPVFILVHLVNVNSTDFQLHLGVVHRNKSERGQFILHEKLRSVIANRTKINVTVWTNTNHLIAVLASIKQPSQGRRSFALERPL